MPNPKIDLDRAASILVDAALLGVREAAKKWEISSRTIDRYQASLQKKPNLSALVESKKRILDVQKSLPSQPLVRDVLLECEDFIRRAAAAANLENPEAIHAIAGAYKIIADARRNDRALEEYLNEIRSQSTSGAGSQFSGHALAVAKIKTIDI